MRLSATLPGLLAMLFGSGVAIAASRFPATPGQNIGPGLFPMMIGAGIALGGTVLMIGGWRTRDGSRRPGAPHDAAESVRLAEATAASPKPRHGLFRAALVIGALAFYALAVETVGFFLTAFVFLATLFIAFGVRRRWIAPLAVAVTFALHLAFYTLLRVPLPWGWLEPLAW